MVVSRLGFEVDSSQAARGAVDLDKLTQSAERAENAERDLSRVSREADTATGQLARSLRNTSTATAQLERTTEMVAAAQGRQTAATLASTVALRENARAVQMAQQNSRQLAFQLIDIGQAIPLAFQSPIYALQNLGFQIAQIGQLYMGQGGMRAALSDSISMVGRFAARMGPAALAVGSVATAIAGMTDEINKASDVTVSFGDVALATFQVVRDGIYEMLRPAIEVIAPWFASAWEMVVSGVKATGNLVINSFRAAAVDVGAVAGTIATLFGGAFQQVKAVWSGLPAALGDFVYSTSNRVVQGIEIMINGAVNRINALVSMLPDWVGVDKIGNVSLGGIENPYAGEGSDLASQLAGIRENTRASLAGILESRNTQVAGIMESDPLGQFFDAVSIRAVQNALAGVEDEAGAAGKALKKAGEEGDAAWRRLAREAERAAERTLDYWKGVGRGFVNDLRQGLEEGKGLWRSLGDAAVGSLQRIADKALEMASDNLITGLLGNLFGGSFLSPRASGAISTGFAGLFANGAAFQAGNVIPFANGGVVSQPTTFPMTGGRTGLMGEAGPEAVMPLRRGPNGRLGVEASNSNQPIQINYSPVYNVAQGADPKAIAELRKAQAEDRAQFQGRVAQSISELRRRNVKV